MYNLEKLEIWQEAVKFSSAVYAVTDNFPKSECFGLTSQLRRASISIAANIAEGSGKHYKKDFSRFLRISLGSLYECVTELFLAKSQGYINPQSYRSLYEDSVVLSKRINALINTLKGKMQNNSTNYQPPTKHNVSLSSNSLLSYCFNGWYYFSR